MCALKDIEAKDRIIVALDCSAKEALQLADSLSGKATWLKIGMTLFYKEGPAFVQALKDKGFKIFVGCAFGCIKWCRYVYASCIRRLRNDARNSSNYARI